MFFRVGFFILLAVVIMFVFLFVRNSPVKAVGAGSWIEYYSEDTAATIKFLNENFGIQTVSTTQTPDGMEYTIIKSGRQLWPFAGIMGLPKDAAGEAVPPSSLVYLTVKDYDSAHQKMIETGAVADMTSKIAGNMKFGIYTIPGGITIGIAQYGLEE
jgi:predicted enzyme related to lactoylglutathione lyase